MSATKKRTRPSKPAEQKPVEPQKGFATLVATEPVTPAEKRGNSTAKKPVATTWIIAHNMCKAAIAEGKPVPARKEIVKAVQDAGIAYYTARTQVQAYLKASQGGTKTPTKLPRDVQIEQ